MNTTWQSWVLDSPRDTWTREFVEKLPRLTLAALYLSTLFSYALAKTLLVDSLHETSVATPSAVVFLFHFGLQAVSFISAAFLMSRVARLATGEPSAFVPWVSMGILAAIPIHLVLPLALLCRSFGIVGRIVFACAEISLWGLCFRRWASAAQQRYNWSFGKSLLVVLSPFLLSGGMMLLSAAFLVVALGLLLLGVLA
jgi:hypothetical protein